MGKSLVIVESPAKAKTINRYLGDDYIVKSSVGHIRDLPVSGTSKVDPKARAKEAAKTRKMTPAKKAKYKKEKARKQLVARMGIDPDDGYIWRLTSIARVKLLHGICVKPSAAMNRDTAVWYSTRLPRMQSRKRLRNLAISIWIKLAPNRPGDFLIVL